MVELQQGGTRLKLCSSLLPNDIDALWLSTKSGSCKELEMDEADSDAQANNDGQHPGHHLVKVFKTACASQGLIWSGVYYGKATIFIIISRKNLSVR